MVRPLKVISLRYLAALLAEALNENTENTVTQNTQGTSSALAFTGGGVVNNFYQTINSPKQLNRLDIYRQSKNLLGYAGGGI